jgi:predicted enzyme related to lactoylglutathione lyase
MTLLVLLPKEYGCLRNISNNSLNSFTYEEKTMGQPVIQWQVLSHNPDKLFAFYKEVFGWEMSANNALGYREIDTGSERGIKGGMWPIPEEAPSAVSLYVEVENVEEAVERATSLGATVAIPPQNLPDGDSMAVIVDPEGIAFGLFKPGRKAI